MDDGFELNLVCEVSNSGNKGSAEATKSAAVGRKRKLRKGKNKYDKRRERSFKGNQQKQQQQQQQQRQQQESSVVSSDEADETESLKKEKSINEDSATEDIVKDDAMQNDDDKDEQEEEQQQQQKVEDSDDEEDEDDVVMKSDENDAIVKSLMGLQSFHPKPAATDEEDDEEDEEDDEDDEEDDEDDVEENENVSSSPPLEKEEEEENKPTELSRRVHSDALTNEEERAKYMAEYHARPLEMDRRSNAAKTIKSSKPSTHIFDDNNNDTTTPSLQQEKEEKNNCPFSSLGLHSRLVTSLTSTRGKFRLERPTIIQCRTLSSLLSPPPQKKHQKQKKGVHNLFVQSETGSGKTLAYLLPIVQSIAIDSTTNEIKKTSRSMMGTRCLIICPTRELAIQTHQIATQLCLSSFSTLLVSCCLSGGEKRKSEKSRLRKGASIVIATPGRLLDHLSKTECFIMSFKKGSLDWLVLDEADRLLDMGLGNQIENIVNEIKTHQRGLGNKGDGVTWRSVLVSATVTKELEIMARKTLGGGGPNNEWKWASATIDGNNADGDHDNGKGKKPNSSKNSNDANDVDADEENNKIQQLANAAPRQLAQLHVTVSAKLRLASLVGFLVGRVVRRERTVVFMSTCDGVDYHHALFSKMDSILGSGDDSAGAGIFGNACRMYKLHGNIPHAERHSILTKFTNDGGQGGGNDDSAKSKSSASILFATDVAARGLNIPGVDWIIQYDPPCETADYVHRAGRTARAGRAGHAVVFLLPSESQYVEILRLRGLNDVTALSLSSTLRTAAQACPEITAEGVKRSGGGYGKVGDRKGGDGRREGEAFAAAVQLKLEDCVKEDDIAAKSTDSKKNKKGKGKKEVGELHEMARQAFWSFLRAYPTKEKAVRQIFSARSLHLGHIARSFALKEPPKALRTNGKQRGHGSANNAKNANNDDSDDEPILKSTGRKRSSRLAFGSSGRSGNDNHHRMGKDDDMTENNDGNIDRGGSKKRQKKSSSKVKSDANFSNHEFSSDRYFPKDEHNGSSKKVKTKSAPRENAQAKMMAAAKKMQSAGMEFF